MVVACSAPTEWPPMVLLQPASKEVHARPHHRHAHRPASLACLYRWERERPDAVYLTQPTGGGRARPHLGPGGRAGAPGGSWLTAQDWPAGSRVALIGKNSAHWILTDLAIQMAGAHLRAHLPHVQW